MSNVATILYPEWLQAMNLHYVSVLPVGKSIHATREGRIVTGPKRYIGKCSCGDSSSRTTKQLAQQWAGEHWKANR